MSQVGDSFTGNITQDGENNGIRSLNTTSGDAQITGNNKTFTVNVTKNVPFTLGTLAWYSGSILDATEVKSHATDEDPWAKEWMAGNSATFGPYHLSSFSSGENATLSLNPGWNKFVPTYSNVVLTAVPDSATRLQAMLTGAADYTFKVDYDQLASAEGNSKVIITEALESRSVELHLNFADEKFADKKVRQAINFAIDRDAIVKGIMGKYGAAADTQLPEVIKGPAAPGSYTQDVEKAKALLAEAGYADGFDMVITVNAVRPGSYASNVALLVANQLADVGINATISVYPSATDFEASIRDDSFEAWLWDSTPALSDPYYYWRLNHHPILAFQNYKGYENAELSHENEEMIEYYDEDDQNAVLRNYIKSQLDPSIRKQVNLVESKDDVVDKIQNLPDDDPQTDRIVQYIDGLLDDMGVGGRLKSIMTNLDDIDDTEVKRNQLKIAKMIASLEMTNLERAQLLAKWKKDELVDTDKILSGGKYSFPDVFRGYGTEGYVTEFIDDLSNWYVRRSRRRFWDAEPVALNTLYFCLKNLTLLLAPMVPFIAEHVWQSLIKVAESEQVESVHLADFPVANKKMVDENLSTSVALSRRLVELGRSARAESGVKIRQPLSRALVSAPGWAKISEEIKTHIAEELNILKLDGIHVAEADLVDVSVKANFRTLGTKFGADVQIIAKAITSANHTEMVKHLRDNKSFKLAVNLTNGSKSAEIDIDDLVVTETPRTGWSVASHAGESLALDLALTPELIQSGLVREVIRAIQEERKKIGLDVSDRITVNWNAPEQVASAITSATAEISAEVLATTLVQDKGQSSDGNELGLWLNLVKN